jgi:hypothetical protein
MKTTVDKKKKLSASMGLGARGFKCQECKALVAVEGKGRNTQCTLNGGTEKGAVNEKGDAIPPRFGPVVY